MFREGRMQKVMRKEIKVGEIVEIGCGVVVPADLLILCWREESGELFIRTD